MFKDFFETNSSSIIALSAIISPVFVALINVVCNSVNSHSERKNEIKNIKLKSRYENQRIAFENFLSVAGEIANSHSESSINRLQASASVALLYCSPENQQRISTFLVDTTSHIRTYNKGNSLIISFSEQLNELSTHLNEELNNAFPY